MRIEASAAYKAYQAAKAQGKERPAAPQATRDSVTKTDTLAISERGQQQSALHKQVQSMAAQVEAQGAQANLARLAAEVRGGLYHVPAQVLADAILGEDVP